MPAASMELISIGSFLGGGGGGGGEGFREDNIAALAPLMFNPSNKRKRLANSMWVICMVKKKCVRVCVCVCTFLLGMYMWVGLGKKKKQKMDQ